MVPMRACWREMVSRALSVIDSDASFMSVAGNRQLSYNTVAEFRHHLLFLVEREEAPEPDLWSDPRYAGVHLACFAMTSMVIPQDGATVYAAVAHLDMGDVLDAELVDGITTHGMENMRWEAVVRRPATTWLRRWSLARGAGRRWRWLTKRALAARVIQRAWRRVVVDPTTCAGQRRIYRWFRDFQQDCEALRATYKI